MPPHPKRSNVWNLFSKTSAGGKCKLCLCEVKTSGNTTNLKKHLQRRHPAVKSSVNINQGETKTAACNDKVIHRL